MMEQGYTGWHAVKLVGTTQEVASVFFKDWGVETYIPMEWRISINKEGKRKRKLRPVFKNLMFIRRSMPDGNLRKLIWENMLHLFVYKMKRNDSQFAVISEMDMKEFRIMCNPDIELRQFISEKQAHLKPGEPVVVTHGPLKGLTGRLVRQSKKYYLLKEVPGMGVMVKVSRWCCEPLEDKTKS